jgi:hypothetical protein
MTRRATRHGEATVHDLSRARLIQALRALHSEYGVYEKCDHGHTADDPLALDIENVGLTCADGLLDVVCTACCTRPFYGQTEDCADGHKHLPGSAICPTMAIVDGRDSPWTP